MSFKQYLRSEITAGLDETYTEDEAWAKNHPGRGYYDVHLSTINNHERSAPIFREYLGGTRGLRILESGCGSGRWMAFFETLGHKAFGVDDLVGQQQVLPEACRAHADHLSWCGACEPVVADVPLSLRERRALVGLHVRAATGAGERGSHRVEVAFEATGVDDERGCGEVAHLHACEHGMDAHACRSPSAH